MNFNRCVCVCVCVCERERERERVAGATSQSCYNNDYEAEESLDKAHNVSVYGNPLWTEEQNPCHNKERSLDTVGPAEKNDANLVVHQHTQEVLEEEDGCRSSSVLPQSDFLMYSSDSSDDEDFHQDGIRDVPFWRPQFHDGDSRSTSQNSSNFEFNPSLESRDFYEQQIPMQDNLKTSNFSHARRMLHSDKGTVNNFENIIEESCVFREETGRDLLKNRMRLKHEKDTVFDSESSEITGNSQGRSKNVSETFFKESNDLQELKLEQYNPMSKNGSDPTRGYKNCVLPHQLHYDLAASDGKNIFASILANNRQGIFWSTETLKKDMSTLSPQEEDYLYQNSDLLASFEVEDYGATNKRIAKEREFATEGWSQNACEDNEVKLLQQNESTKNEDVVKEFCDVDNTKEKRQMLNKTKETRHFDDTSSWSSQNSEELNPKVHAGDVTNACDALTIKDCVREQGKDNLPLVKTVAPASALPIPVDIALSSTTLPCHREDKALLSKPQESDMMEKVTQENNVMMSLLVESARLNTAVPHHRVDGKPSISRPQEFQKMEKLTKESSVAVMGRDIKGSEQEILELKKENGRLMKFLKESEQKLDNFTNERVLWEQKKLSEMSAFNAFKENETQRLKRERTKLEKQTKLLAQLPSKKERNEIEELRVKIANLISEHAKKENLQNLTINRLRRTITDLTEQIYALEEEVRRYERFLYSDVDANEDSRKKPNLPKLTAGERLQTISPQHVQDELSSNSFLSKDTKSQNGTNGSRVSTVMHWTRA